MITLRGLLMEREKGKLKKRRTERTTSSTKAASRSGVTERREGVGGRSLAALSLGHF